jgi:uncharacterized protein (DUF1697 family)
MVAISLLRGINVGGNNMVRMEALRSMHEALGLADVRTYIQSGNVVFRTKLNDPAAIGRKLEDAVEKSLGFRPAVVIRTAEELRDVVANNPFAGRPGIEPNKLAVSFLTARPDAAAAERLRTIKADPEELHLVDRELYMYFPEGMGRSKLPPMLDRTFKIPGTARNWNTVMKLLAMAEELEG